MSKRKSVVYTRSAGGGPDGAVGESLLTGEDVHLGGTLRNGAVCSEDWDKPCQLCGKFCKHLHMVQLQVSTNLTNSGSSLPGAQQ